MQRRTFLSAPALLLGQSSTIESVTQGPKHHFFGYYGIPPWNRSQKLLVCLESDFQDHLPDGDEAARVVLIDARTRKLTPVAETRAWNVQQGAMLHWNPLAPETEILFNDRQEDRLVTVVLNVENGKRRTLPMALAGVSNNGQHALCLNYARLAKLRPVVGIKGVKDTSSGSLHPEDDGAFLMDLKTGEARIVLSVADTFRRLESRHPELRQRPMFFNHTVFSKDDKRFFVLSRAFAGNRLESAMFSANLDGSDVREAVPYGRGVSHFDWKNGKEILATFRDEAGVVRHYLFPDGGQTFQVLGADFFSGDGHCSYSPDTQWIVSDANHLSSKERELLLYHPASGEGHRLGRFAMGDYMTGDLRCDLHPRFSRDGKMICFDAIAADGTRQLHIAKPPALA
ncbi:hypothetical protein QQ054_34020 [Oscillatoria amoena NRMC-F 0135]|nr:hypothetical protein [Oscillatoria amoena NRMC-F 0135]